MKNSLKASLHTFHFYEKLILKSKNQANKKIKLTKIKKKNFQLYLLMLKTSLNEPKSENSSDIIKDESIGRLNVKAERNGSY